MKNQQLLDWLQKHLRVQIGHMPDGMIGEVIVDNWKEFLAMVYENRGKIIEITWWEYCSIGGTSIPLGGGGPIDPREPKYFWSELYSEDFVATFSPDITQEEVFFYIENTIDKYAPAHMLSPAFTILCGSIG